MLKTSLDLRWTWRKIAIVTAGIRHMIKRILQTNILKTSFHGQVLIIQGPRQVGKTTLALEIVKGLKAKGEARIFNCDDPDHRELLENKGLDSLRNTIGFDVP